MGTTPTTDNKIADILNGVISALMSGGVAAAEAYVTALDPALWTIPIVAWLLDEGISYLGQIVSVAAQKVADQIVIDIQTHGEESSVINTAVALQLALSSGNSTDIDLATQNLRGAWASLIHWDGSAQPKP